MQPSRFVHYKTHGQIAVIETDKPPVNALCDKVRGGIWQGLEAAEADPAIKAIVIACRGRTFFVGADVSDFSLTLIEPTLHQLIERIEVASKPVIAAMHGNALGGGLEIALACHYRCAVPGTSFGFPEVRIGVIPGAGGCVRSARLMPLEQVLEFVALGNFISTDAAQAIGLIDRTLGGELLGDAMRYAEELAETGAPLRQIRTMDPAMDVGAVEILAGFRAHMNAAYRGHFAPERAVRAVESALQLPFDEAIEREFELFNDCESSPEHKALQHTFFALRAVSKAAGVGKADMPARVDAVTIVGTNTDDDGLTDALTGCGIALVEQGPVQVVPGAAVSAEKPVSGETTIALTLPDAIAGTSLLEITRSGETSPQTVGAALQIARQMKATPVISLRSPALPVLEGALRSEIDALVGEGHPRKTVLCALWDFGFAEGVVARPATPPTDDQHTLADRVVKRLAAAGRALIDSGVLTRPLEVDVLCLNGLGFPAFRGGPMFMQEMTDG